MHDPRLTEVIGRAMSAEFAQVSPTGTDAISVNDRIAAAVVQWYEAEYLRPLGYKVLTVRHGQPGYHDDWNAEIYPTLQAAAAEAREARGSRQVDDAIVVSLREEPFPPEEP